MRRPSTSVLFALSASASALGASTSALCTSSQLCWPSPSTWASFNTSIDGRLVAPRPPAWPCHDPHYDAALCAAAQTNWTNSFWRSGQTGAMQSLLWDSAGCGIDTPRNLSCKQGTVPTYAVVAESEGDVSAAVKFAKKHRIKLVVKNTGHDYLGRSTGAGTLSIWTHNLGGMNFTDSFVADGCSGNQGIPAVTLGAAAQWYDVYKAADEHNVTIVGGNARSVGAAGGWVLGGGHSPLAGKYGLGVDNVLQFQIVKADGSIVIANKCKNKDLFWALRGGGGNTWGVLLKVTYKTHPPLKSVAVLSFSINTTDSKSLAELSEVFIRTIPNFTDAGVRAYVSWLPPGPFSVVMLQPDGLDVQSVNNTLQPVWDWVKEHPGTSASTFGSTHPSFFGYVENYVGDIAAATNIWLASRLVSRDALLKRSKQLAKFTLGDGSYVGSAAIVVGGGAVNNADPDSTGLNPAWRKDALVVWTIIGILPSTFSEEVANGVKSNVTRLTQELGEVAGLDDASYLNEADPVEPKWKKSFFGSHYSRLLKIKQEVDPSGLFECNRCIGSP